jgi:short-subunit dehydrogenase
MSGWADARIWITGASSGIGEALVDGFARRGARIALTARRADRLQAIAARNAARVTPVAETISARLLVIPADVTDRASVSAAAQEIEARWGAIDLAIFSAGGSIEHGRSAVDDAQSERDADVGRRDPHPGLGSPQRAAIDREFPRFLAGDYTDTMALNYFSVVYGIDAVLPGMLARGSGHIAAVASLAGYRAMPTAGAYGASKAAVIHMLDSLRFAVEPRGVRVSVINPGFVRTPLTARHTFYMPFLVDAADAAERIVSGLEHGRREIHFPAPLSWMMKLFRILPYGPYARVMKTISPPSRQ